MEIKAIENIPAIIEFKKKLKKKIYPNSTIIAIETANFFKNLIQSLSRENEIKNFPDLLKLMVSLGKGFISVDRLQFSVGNIVKRILHIIREEYNKLPTVEEKPDIDKDIKRKRLMSMTSLNTLIDYSHQKIVHTPKINMLKYINNLKEDDDRQQVDETLIKSNGDLRENIANVITNISELIDELESISVLIKDQSYEHINDNEIILTANHSDQLEEFFVEASQKKTFHVIIAESAPTLK
jgi:translation initiation factor eIF-2B subunit beta